MARQTEGRLQAETLAELRAALEAGCSPAAALAAVGHGEVALAAPARAARLGRPLAEVADDPIDDPAVAMLVRSLAVAERAGAGALEAVTQAERALADEAETARLLRIRTAQARGTARMLLAIPCVAWLLLVGLDPGALRFYLRPVGWVTAGLALALAAAGHRWSGALVTSAAEAAAAADPLSPPPGPRDPVRAALVALPVAVVLGVAAGAFVGLVGGGVAAAIGLRRRPDAVRAGGLPDAVRTGGLPDAARAGRRAGSGGGGTAEAVELVAVAVEAGLPPAGAVAAVASLAPAAARRPLREAARRLRDGWEPRAAFEGGGLAELGSVLHVTGAWGAPAAPALRRLAADLRARRRAAAEEAAERVQLALVFPTTLLTLPAFLLAVVPPMLWAALAGTGWAA